MTFWDNILGRAKHVVASAMRCQVASCAAIPISTCMTCGRLVCPEHGFFNVKLFAICAACTSTVQARASRQKSNGNGSGVPRRPPRPPQHRPNPYEVLEIPMSASKDEIKAAYRAQVKRYHPDGKHPNPQMFRRVQSAYEELTR